MTNDARLQIIRRAYAKQIMHAADASNPHLEDAFANLHREDFLFPPPWQLMHVPERYHQTPDHDPVYLYQDVPVAIVPERELNNGQPSFLALLISVGGLKAGERAVHIGTGTGYYTAVMSWLAGEAGRVLGVEFDPELAALARANLAQFSNVEVMHGDGATLTLQPADVIYVNAGATSPAATWLDALKPGGRLVLPLTATHTTAQGNSTTRGAVFLVTRHIDDDAYDARSVSSVCIYPCTGLRDEASENALIAAFENDDAQSSNLKRVRRLYRTSDIPDHRCWMRGAGWCLAYD